MQLEIPYQIFGPMPQGYTSTPGLEFLGAGAAASASTKQLNFSQPTPRVVGAAVLFVWLPQTVHRALIRWHWYDAQNQIHIETIQELTVPNVTGGPATQFEFFLPKMQELQARNQTGMVSVMFKGDGVTPLTIHEVRLLLTYRFGYYGAE